MSDDFYYAFSEKFRGSRELIMSRLRVYLPFVDALKLIKYDCFNAVDLGCGRGEWLELLKENGVSGVGVDKDQSMLALCYERGLSVHNGDAIAYLKALPAESQLIISGFHIVEHIPFEVLQILVSESLRVLKPGGLLILETPNPENLVVGSSSFYLDPTHQRPIHPLLLSFLPEYYKFYRTKIVRLQETLSSQSSLPVNLQDVIMGVSPDYAVIAQKKHEDANEMRKFDGLFNKEYGLSLDGLIKRYDNRSGFAKKIYNAIKFFVRTSFSKLTLFLKKSIHVAMCFKKKIITMLMRSKHEKISTNTPKHIAIDLTPLLPGGENGGAKLMTVELIKSLGQLMPQCKFMLLTSEKNHDELVYLDSANVYRSNRFSSAQAPMDSVIKKVITRILSHSFMDRLRPHFDKLKWKNIFLKNAGVDLLFCPFTEPCYYHPDVPVVSVVYDLQHCYYPQLFSENEIRCRNRYLKKTYQLATRIICISNYVRQTILENSNLDPDKIVTSHIRLCNRLKNITVNKFEQIFSKFNLLDNQFILYPANFWLHKNHRMLFTAFGMYRARHPNSILKLVCTGASSDQLDLLKEHIYRMGLTEWIVFPGYLSNQEFSILMNSCRAVIYPSLYEGFGMPILEAMAHKKPVFCSELTSMPEVGGNAAGYFDPRKPEEIVDALITIENNFELLANLVEEGQKHTENFGNSKDMAIEYWNVFCDAMNNNLEASKLI